MPIWSPWTVKPWTGTPILRHHPMARNLVEAWLYNEGATYGFTNAVDPTQTIGAVNGGVVPGSGYDGVVLAAPTSGDLATTGTVYSGAPWSIFFRVIQTDATEFYQTIYADNGGSYGIWLAGQKMRQFGNSGSRAGDSTLSLNVWHSCSISSDGTDTSFYLDGQPDGVRTGSADGWNSLTVRMMGPYGYLAGSLSCLYLWSRTLTDVEHRLLHENPWQFFAPPFGWLAISAPPASARAPRPLLVFPSHHTSQFEE